MITPVNLLSSSRTKAAASALSPLILRAITAQQQPHEGGCQAGEFGGQQPYAAQQQPHEGGCFKQEWAIYVR